MSNLEIAVHLYVAALVLGIIGVALKLLVLWAKGKL